MYICDYRKFIGIALYILVSMASAFAITNFKMYEVPPQEKLKAFIFVDVHSHITNPNQDLDEVIRFMRTNNVKKMVLQGMNIKGKITGADAITKKAVIQCPDKFIALSYEFIPTDPAAVEYVRKNMDSGLFKGIGEIFINGHGIIYKGDSKIMMNIYSVVGKKHGVVASHWTIGSNSKNEPGSEAKLLELKNALRSNPKTIFIIAHCGAGPPPPMPNYQKTMEGLLNSYPNLYFDLAGMHVDFYDSDGKITQLGEIWLSLIKRYPSRFMVGFDLGCDDYSDSHKTTNVVNLYRRFLGNLPDDVAKKVSSGNAIKVFEIP